MSIWWDLKGNLKIFSECRLQNNSGCRRQDANCCKQCRLLVLKVNTALSIIQNDSLSGIRTTVEGQQQRFRFQPGLCKCLNYTKSSAVAPVSSGVSGRKLTSCLCSGYRQGLYPALSNINYYNGYHANELFFSLSTALDMLACILHHVVCYALKNSCRIN